MKILRISGGVSRCRGTEQLQHLVDDLAFPVNTRKAAFKYLFRIVKDAESFGILNEQVEIPEDRLEGCPQLMGNGNNNPPASFIIELYCIFKKLFFGDVNKIDQGSRCSPE